MKIHLKKVLLYILAATMFLAMLPMQYAVATAPGEPGITLSSASLYAGKYYYDSATVTGVDIRTILISFSGSVTTGDAIVLPASTPAGFTVSASSASNNYTKRINLNAGIAASDVQDYIRGVGFTLASQTQTVQITITTEDIAQDTFYNADTGHYYQFIPDTTSTWIQAYNAAKVMMYMGRSGYLATVMSLGEDTFVNALSNGKTGWLGGTILTNTGSSAGSLYYNGFNDNSVVSTGWYWACGPEKGTTFYNVNTLYPNNTNTTFTNQKDALNSTYYNWSRGIANEPNNNTAGSFYMNSDYETCLSTLKVSGRTGKHGTDFAWNDIRYNYAGSDSYHANGYVVEYGDQLFGDSGSAGNTFATASGTLEAVYTAAVNTNTDGAPAAAQGSVTLTQSGTTVYTLSGGATGIYTASAINGSYDVYINNEDTGKDIAINNGNGSVTVNYYTVSFAVSNAGTASGSTVSATAGGSSIASGAPVLAGKAVTLTATGAGASSYTYLWSGSGTSGETTASITIPSLSGTVNATCTVTGAPAAYEVNVYTATDSIFGPAPGVVELKQNDVTMYTAASNGTGRYTTNAVNGTYDVFINNEDTKKDILVNSATAGVTVNYYTVSFAVADAGTASGSTISTISAGKSITSGTVVLAGNGVKITAAGAGADSYTYAWTGPGTSGEMGPVFQFSVIPGPLDVLCTVTGTTAQATHAADIFTFTDGALAPAPGIVELKQGGVTVYTASIVTTGRYSAAAVNGTYDIYINNEDTGKNIWISGVAAGEQVDYYTVSFAAANAGTAAGSTVSATAGGTPITSGTAVMAGKTVTITTVGAGADSYTYLWSGSGTSGETAEAITIPSLTGTVNALCTVTGTTAQPAYAADIYTATNGVFAAAQGSVELKQGGVTVYTLNSSGTTGLYTVQAVDGTYDIYINNEDTGKKIIIGGAAAGVQVDYYTVGFAVANAGTASGSTISATAGGVTIASGTAVLKGKVVSITATGAGADTYAYLWSGSGTSGETTAAIIIPTLSGTVNALCTVMGTTAPVTHAADIYTFIDGALAPVPGTVELKQGGVTVYTASNVATGLYTMQAVDGTYDIYINNEDTGEDIQVRGVDVGEGIDYYTVSFAVENAGTASGSIISATAGGVTIASSAVVLEGKPVILTALGAGADTYTYLWSGAGTSSETAAVITIPALSGTVNALCTVTGTTTLEQATICTYTDGIPAAVTGAVELKQGSVTKYTAVSSAIGVYTAFAVHGTYDVCINNEDTGVDVVISTNSATAAVNYYTVSFSAQDAGIAWGSTVSATVGGTPVVSGTAVLAGKAVTLTGHGAGATLYVYAWSGPGINGEFGNSITIYPSGTVNALCRVTGTTTLNPALIYTYADGALATVPGSVQLWRGGAAIFTADSSSNGVYTVFAAYGTFDIYINNEDTGEDFTFSSSVNSASVYYYTVSFAVANAGTASGSTITATAGGTPIASGAAVLPGKAVTITAQGAGADTYAYLWSGAGTSGETAAAIVIPTLNGTVNALCTITGTSSQVTYAADIYTAIDGVFAAAPGSVELKQGGVTVYTLGSSGTTGLYTVQAVDGTYDIYINNEDTGKNILIGGAAAGVQVDYYTVNFAVANAGTSSGSTVSATAGGTPISSGTTVLACKSVTITALGAGASAYTYLWSGSGTSGETAAAIAIPKLTGTVNALCCITGTANTYTPGTITEEVSDTTISAEGLFTQDARLIIIPLADGESDREELESLLSGKQTAAAFEVHVEPANAFKAPLTLSFQLGEQYNGRTVYILHKLHSGKVEQFTVVVTSGEAVITVQELSPFLLTVDPPVTLTAQPQNVTVVTGQTATFTVTATGTEPLTYQWQKKTSANASWEDIPGAVNPKHTTSQANLSNSGFQYRVIVTDAYGRSVTSSAATLTVTKAPEPPATGDHSQPALYMALIILFMLSTFLLLRKRKAV